MKILFVHLLNNYTGSPKVLNSILEELEKDNNFQFDILTSKTEGFISLNKIIDNKYRFYKKNKILTFFSFLYTQVYMFLKVFFSDKYDLIYINTILPFGAAIAAKLKRKKIIVHVHEVNIQKKFLFSFCFKVLKKLDVNIITVSNFVRDYLITIGFKKINVIYNFLDYNYTSMYKEKFENKNFLKEKYNNKIILLPCSLNYYKGIEQFILLSKELKDYNFVLVISSNKSDCDNYLKKFDLPQNLSIFCNVNNMKDFYLKATLTLNLSLPDKWVETFGMTILESFCFWTPVLAPNCGGPKEIIDDGVNGYLINPYEIKELSEKIFELLNNFDSYKCFCKNSKEKSKEFSNFIQINKLKEVLKCI